MTKTALLFAGQGAQKVGMGKDLAERFPEARALCDRARAALGYDLSAVCFEGPETELTKTVHAQPGIFLASWMAFQLLKECVPGFSFEAAAGLSLGEFTALAAAGLLSFEEGLKVVRQRGQFMQEACERSKGSMAAIIGLDEQLTRQVCVETAVELANLNCPGQLVISGEINQINRACELARTKGAKKAVLLQVAGAYHSRLMAQAQPGLKAALGSITLACSTIPVISNVTARPHGPSAEVPARLVEQVTSSVRWEESMRYLLLEGFNCFIELGPGKALSGFMRRIDATVRLLNVEDVPSLARTAEALVNS